MSAQIIAQLKALSLYGMAASFPEVAAQARHTEFNPESFMQELMAAESAQRLGGISARKRKASVHSAPFTGLGAPLTVVRGSFRGAFPASHPHFCGDPRGGVPPLGELPKRKWENR